MMTMNQVVSIAIVSAATLLAVSAEDASHPIFTLRSGSVNHNSVHRNLASTSCGVCETSYVFKGSNQLYVCGNRDNVFNTNGSTKLNHGSATEASITEAQCANLIAQVENSNNCFKLPNNKDVSNYGVYYCDGNGNYKNENLCQGGSGSGSGGSWSADSGAAGQGGGGSGSGDSGSGGGGGGGGGSGSGGSADSGSGSGGGGGGNNNNNNNNNKNKNNNGKNKNKRMRMRELEEQCVCDGGQGSCNSVSFDDLASYPYPSSGICRARLWGDPHIVTWDNLRFDAQRKGYARLAKSDATGFEVQGLFTESNGNWRFPSITTGIAVNPGGAGDPTIEVILQDNSGNTILSNRGQTCEIDMYVNKQLQDSIGYDTSKAKVERDNHSVRITYPGKAVIEMQTSYYGGCLFNVDITLLDCDLVECGLLGTPSGSKQDDWTNTDCSPTPIPPGVSDFFFEPAFVYSGTWMLQCGDVSLFHTPMMCPDTGPFDNTIQSRLDDLDDDIQAACTKTTTCDVNGQIVDCGTTKDITCLVEAAAADPELALEAVEDFNDGDDCDLPVVLGPTPVKPEINIEKTSKNGDVTCTKSNPGSETAIGRPGDTFTYCYLIENTGDVELCSISLTDKGSAVTVPGDCIGVGASVMVTGNHFTKSSNEATEATVYGTVSCDYCEPAPGYEATVTDEDPSGIVIVDPSITLETTSRLIDDPCSGSTDLAIGTTDDHFGYCYSITNTGDVTLCGITLAQPNSEAAAPTVPGCINPGQTKAVEGGQFSTDANESPVATVSGIPQQGPNGAVTASDGAEVKIVAPGISLVKLAKVGDETCDHGKPLAVGAPQELFGYCYTITNTGADQICGLSLVDPNSVSDSPPLADDCVAGHSSIVVEGIPFGCSNDSTFKCTDNGGENTQATVSGTDPYGNTVDASDSAGVALEFCPAEMSNMGSDYCPGNTGVYVWNAKPGKVGDPLPSAIRQEFNGLEDSFTNIQQSPNGDTISFNMINIFKDADHLTMYVEFEEPIAPDNYSSGKGRNPICVGGTNVWQCGLQDEAPIVAGCIGADGPDPYALVTAYFIDTTDALYLSATTKVNDCCKAEESGKVFRYSFAIKCGCPTTSRLLRGHR